MNEKNIILVVEDEEPLSEAITTKLSTRGYETVTARKVDQALEYLRTLDNIKAVWLDHYLLGNANGLDLVTKLKTEGSEWKKIPVFVVSNTATKDKVQSYIRLGVEKYYVKAENKLDQIIEDIDKCLEED